MSLKRPDERFKNRALYVNALGTEANLARIKKSCFRDPSYSVIKITVGKDDRRILAAQFKRHWFY